MGFRRRVRRRALIVGGVAGGAIAAHHVGKVHAEQQAQEQEQQPQEQQQQQQQARERPADTDQDQAQHAPPPADPADELEHLAQLHASGALTDEEFTEAKAKILGS